MLNGIGFRWLCLLFSTLIVVLGGCRTQAASSPGMFYVFKDGQASAAIILPDNASAGVKKAVDEFRKDLQKGYQVDVPVGTGSNLAGRIELVVEERPLAAEDKTEITFPAQNAMRITGGESGVIRALFFLLEEFGGIRYLYPGEPRGHGTHFPRISELSIPCATIRRDSCFPLERATAMAKQPNPGMLDRYYWPWEAKLGTKSRMCFSHDLSKIALPVSKYRGSATRPDDKIFPILGAARFLPYEQPESYDYAHWQPCYSGRESADEAVKNLLAYLRQNPQTKSLGLGINDNGGFCECAACLKLDGKTFNQIWRYHRSESYYRWANQVVGRVTAEFPGVTFSCLAYREVLEPPSFKLHPNIVPGLCFDFHACADPEIRARREKLISAWNDKCDHLAFYAYDYGDIYYSLPRVYFSETRDMIKFFYNHKGAGAYTERSYFTFNEGPKIYLLLKLLENPDLDMEATLDDWYTACVGEKAAPYLRQYYDFWTDFWRTKAVKTSWWQSRGATYLSLAGHFGTYMYGLGPDDMPHCRQLMEKVVELAQYGTPDQKIRAQMQMKCFEWSEAAAVACGAGIYSTNGTLPDAASAVRLANAVPDAVKSIKKWQYLLTADPLTQAERWYAGTMISNSPAATTLAVGNLLAVGDYLADPAVKAAVKNLSVNRELPPDICFVAENMLKEGSGSGNADNLAGDGGFEKGGDDAWTMKNPDPACGKIGRVDDVACSGKGSLKCVINHRDFTVTKVVLGVKPNTAHYFAARIFIPADQKPSLEGRLLFWGEATCEKGKSSIGSAAKPEIRLSPGKWNYVCAVVPRPWGKNMDSVRLNIRLFGFEKGAVVYVDDVQLFQMP